jgi:CRP-like cAMP-binding protein
MPTARPRDTFAAQASGLSGPHQNHLLETLPDDVYERLRPHLELRELKRGEVLYEPGERLPYVYFPASKIISLLYVMEDGASAEIAIVGNVWTRPVRRKHIRRRSSCRRRTSSALKDQIWNPGLWRKKSPTTKYANL